MRHLIKTVIILVVFALLGLMAFSYLPGALTPDQTEISHPVTLNAH